MAEPQTNATTEQNKAKAEAAQGAAAEPRSFGETKTGEPRGESVAQPARAAEALAQAAQPAIEGGREIAEQGRRATRQMADAWRQAIDPVLAMQYDFSQMFDDLFRQTFGFRAAPTTHPLRPFAHLSAVNLLGLPPADLKETETAHQLAIEVPGLTRDDIDLSIVGDTLVVCGHKAEETQDASATHRFSERRYGRFERAFPLAPDVDRAGIDARLDNGVLKITLPKQASAAPQRARIEIKG
jgi:HSP20 family protein